MSDEFNSNDVNNVQPVPAEESTQPVTNEAQNVSAADEQPLFAPDYFEKNSSKGKSKAPIVAAAIVGVAAIAGVSAAAISTSPKNVIKRAFTQTTTELAARDSVYKHYATPENLKLLSEGSYTLTQDLSIVDMPDGEDLKGLGVSFGMDVDNQAKQGNLNIKANYKGLNLDVINAYTDNETILFNMPALCNKTFSLQTSNILEQAKKSPAFAEYVENAGDKDISIRPFDAPTTQDAKDVERICVDAVKKLNDSIKYTKADAREITVGERTVKAKGYTANIPAEDATAFVVDTINKVYASDTMQKRLKENAEKDYKELGFDSADAYMQDYSKRVSDFTSKLKIGDVSATFYIYQKNIADSDVKFDLTYDGKTTTVTADGGIKDPTTDEAVKANIHLTNSNGKTISLAYEDNVTKDTALNEKYTLTMFNGTDVNGAEDASVITFDSKYDEASGDIDATAAMGSAKTDSDSKLKIVIDANLKKEDNKTKFKADNVELMSADGSMGKFSMNTELAPLDGKVEKPEGEPIKLFEMSEDEYEEVQSDIQNSLFGLAMQLK